MQTFTPSRRTPASPRLTILLLLSFVMASASLILPSSAGAHEGHRDGQGGAYAPDSGGNAGGDAPYTGDATVATGAVAQDPGTAASTGMTTDAAAAESDIVAIIYAAADAYGQSREDMLRVATCESGLDPNNVTPPYSASGLFQFLPSTWASTPYADQDIFDPVASANAAAWMWSVGRRGEWVCQ